jgi:AP-1 complex subunit gamma-1
MLLDLMGGDAGPSSEVGINGGGQQHNADLLADILGGNTVASPTSPIANGSSTGRPQQGNAASIMDLFDSQPTQPQQPQQQQRPAMPASTASNDILGSFSSGATSPPAQQAHTAYNKNSLFLTFTVSRNAQAVQVQARFKNTSSFESLGQVNLQAAVPKTQKLQLQAISNSELGPGAEASQAMRVTSVQGVSHCMSSVVRLRVC